jgi:hypothetical protein
MLKMVRYKLIKNMLKNDRFWEVKKWVENDEKMTILRGGKNVKNRQISIPGTRTPQIINFLKFCSFLQKLPHF